MKETEHRKKEPWRILLGAIAVIFIVYMWLKKDMIAQYAAMPSEQMIPMIATTAAVSLIKAAVLAVGIFLIKRFIDKISKK